MLELNVFSMLIFTALNVIAASLVKGSEEGRRRALKLICIALLTFNLCRYSMSPLLGKGIRIPVEFSSVAYFLTPLLLLTGIKRLQGWAVYSGLMAGFFYYTAMLLAGGKIYGEYPPYDTYISLCCHGTLYLLGLVGLKTGKPIPSDKIILPLGVGLVALNAYLLRPVADTGVRLFIYELMDGLYIKNVLPQTAWRIGLPVYYLVMASLVLLSVGLFYKLNKAQYEKTKLCAKPENTTVKSEKIAPLYKAG